MAGWLWIDRVSLARARVCRRRRRCGDRHRLTLLLLARLLLENGLHQLHDGVVDADVVLGRGLGVAAEAILLPVGRHLRRVLARSLLGEIALCTTHDSVSQLAVARRQQGQEEAAAYLVGDQHDGDRLLLVARQSDLLVEVALPLLHGLECTLARDVEHDQRADGLLIVHARHVAESLLAGDIPELQADDAVVEVDDLERKVDADLFKQASNRVGELVRQVVVDRGDERTRTVAL